MRKQKLKHKYINLLKRKKRNNNIKETNNFNHDFIYYDYYENIDKLDLYEYTNDLNILQKEIIFLKYFNCNTDDEIATILKKSRKTINKNRNFALNKLREKYKNL